MKAIVFSFFIIFGSMVQAQQNQFDSNGKRHGHWLKQFENGKVRYEGTFDHGIPVDTFKYYFETGELRTLNIFRAKTGTCMSMQYGEGEILAGLGLFVNQKKDSTWTFYDQDGNVVMREDYEDGKRNGKSKSLFPNGKPAEIHHYKNDVKEGEWRQFYESGKKMASGTFVNGSLQGEAVYCNSNGKPRLKGSYVKGLMHGKWFYFDDNMEIEKTEVWKMGRLQEPENEEKEISQK